MGGLALTSCNDFLDRSPISDITPEDYFNTVDQVGSYVINYYDDYLENSNTTKMYHQRAWNSGVVRNDANTDNLLSDDGNLDYFAGNKQVPEGKNIQEPLNRIRVWNYLFETIKGAKYIAVSTPGDILLHIRAKQMGLCFEFASIIDEKLKGVVDSIDETHGFRYMDGKAIIGFVDGTENPAVDENPYHFAVIGDEDPDFIGGSYILWNISTE